MTDREKVVKAVETCFDSWIDGHRNMGLDLNEVERMKRDALELLKEQEAVKPILVKLYPHDVYKCGNCGHCAVGTTVPKTYRPKYCPECGRKVKWDESVD